MSYSNLYLQSKSKVPLIYIVIAALTTVGLAATVFFSGSRPSKASKRSIIQKEIVNVYPHQVGIFWQTEKTNGGDVGWVAYTKKGVSEEKIALDERDFTEKRSPHKFHYVILKELDESTDYEYKIISNNEVIRAPDGQPFHFKTPPNKGAILSSKPAYGTLIKSNGDPAHNIIVFMRFKNAYSFFDITKEKGDWLIPVQYVVNTNTGLPQPISENEKVTLKMISEEEENVTSTVDTIVKKLSPLPQTLIFGQNYTLVDDNVLSVSDTRALKRADIDVLFPKERSLIPGNRPLLKGFGIPGKKVMLVIGGGQNQTIETSVDEKGQWSAEVIKKLPVGNYTLTFTTEDAEGKNKVIVRTFSIAKEGEQVLGSATPEATLTPTLPVGTSTPTPTLGTLPTATLAPVPPLTSATPVPPTTGINSIPLAIISFSLVVVGLGFLVVF
ncbi:MAG: hypothetical protein Q7S61_05150 [bacterium]|nr:hypothetical protein [bacterium]